ncbi:MAG: DUF983 domain-containing protein [Sphingomicrobium sp.]|nr:DUF983 domain-containing protein [Sphingomonadales bacterium]
MTGAAPDAATFTPPGRGAAALKGLCPRCGAADLFDGSIGFAPNCRSCGLDFAAFNLGDGPAAFLILIVGAILTIGAITLELAESPPYWVHLIWVPIGIALTIGGLRIGKAFLIFQEYSHRAREGRTVR